MKQYFKYGLIGICLVGMASCIDTMDTHPTESFDESTVWGSKATADAFVYSTYENVINVGWGGSSSCVAWEARTPNSIRCSQVGEGIDGIATELGISAGSDFGANRFGVLRKCNMIIENVQKSEALSEGEKAELIAQGHFLRGMVFFDQARKMGRFVPVTQVFSVSDSLACRIPMTTSPAESYEYVIADLEKAVEGLPESAPSGIANKYAAEVILSRAALQAYAYTQDSKYLDKAIRAAKDVIDNSGVSLSANYGGMFNETDNLNREILWGYYRLSTNTQIGGYEELIRTYPNISADDVTMSKSPVPFRNANGRTFEGWAIYFPTQDLVDQYLVTDETTGAALPWYETSQYKNNVEEQAPSSITTPGQIDAYERTNGEMRRMPTQQDLTNTKEGYPHFTRYARLKSGVARDISSIMYENRDKRFASSIVYDNCTWIGETVETNLGGNSSQGVRDKEDGGWYNTVTGYYWRKCNVQNPDPRAYFNCLVSLHYCLARVGEAYMNLAEAYLLKGEIAKAVEALNATRTTHGGLAPSTASTEADAWADYIRERRVEMANEGGDIYFSYLRWGKYGGHANYGRSGGDIVYDLDRPAYKIEIDRNRSTLLIGQVTLLNSANRTFTPKRYLFPVAQSFLDTREAYGLDHTQNEGW